MATKLLKEANLSLIPQAGGGEQENWSLFWRSPVVFDGIQLYLDVVINFGLCNRLWVV